MFCFLVPYFLFLNFHAVLLFSVSLVYPLFPLFHFSRSIITLLPSSFSISICLLSDSSVLSFSSSFFSSSHHCLHQLATLLYSISVILCSRKLLSFLPVSFFFSPFSSYHLYCNLSFLFPLHQFFVIFLLFHSSVLRWLSFHYLYRFRVFPFSFLRTAALLFFIPSLLAFFPPGKSEA